jgi:L-fuconolactonase
VCGIVAAASIERGAAVREELTALRAFGPLVRGVRRNLQAEPDPTFCLKPDFVAGVRLLPEFGLTFDLCIAHTQLPPVTALVHACPETQFILDHLGKPDVRRAEPESWRADIVRLAALPNVVCKLSGLSTEADHQQWCDDDLRPYLAHALAVFGPERVFFGSDWPVALLATEYRRWVEVLEMTMAQLSPVEQQGLWYANAHRIYGVNAPKAMAGEGAGNE